MPGVTLRAKLRDAGAGVVWSGRVDATGVECTVRVLGLPAGGDARDRAAEAAQRLVTLRHPHLVTVLDAIPTPDGLALLTEPVTGAISLGRLLGVRERIEPGEVVTIGLPVAQALAAAHAAGVAHGRLGRDDILLEPNGRPVLAGVGLTGLVGFPGNPSTDVRDLADLLLDAMLHATGPDAAAVAVAVATALVDDPARRPSAAEIAAGLARSCAPAPVRLVSEPIPPLAMPPPPPGVTTAPPRPGAAVPTGPGEPPRPVGTGDGPAAGDRTGAGRAEGVPPAREPAGERSSKAAPGAGPGMAPGAAAGRGAAPADAAPADAADVSAPVTLGDTKPMSVSGGTGAGAGAAKRPLRGTTRGRGAATSRSGTNRGGKTVGGGNRGRQAVAKGRGADAETQRKQPARRRRRVPFVLVGLVGVALAALVAVLVAGGRSDEPSPADTASGSGGGSAQPAASGGEPPATQPPETQQTPQNQTPEERWRATLDELNAARTEAFESGDETVFSRVYAPGSNALAQDTTLLREIAARRAHLSGGGLEIEALEVREEGAERVVLRVTERRLPASYVAEDGAVLATETPKPPQTRDLLLVDTDDGWRIADLFPVTN